MIQWKSGGVAERHPELGIEDLLHAVKVLGSHANHGEGAPGKHDAFADDLRVGIEVTLPQSRTEHDLRRVVFAMDKAAAKHHGEFKHAEEVCGDSLAPHALRLRSAADRGGDELVVTGYIGEGFRLVAHIGVERVGEGIAAALALGHSMQREQRRRVADGRGPQNEAADHGEDGGVGADAETDGHNRDCRCTAMFE